ncbi:hypothetical protein IP510_13375 [Psychrobacter sp. NG254]|uniref:hypothetical protein n=1 Tax=unclassified Psychrobacter TaxID=196806 RepID=UPI0018883977|nr:MULTISPECIES: hypothetical protein [unclassified Psychrobacter]MBF2720873.1 hypothetical protein [Psychrobacter sp. NG254]MBH0006786.1 hypothetical protein [Psychrobacter sp. SWN149]
MKNFNLKNIAISSLIAVSTCFAAIGTANAAPQPDTHHLTQKQKNAIEAKQKAKQQTKQVVVVKAKPKAKQVVVAKAKPKAKQVVIAKDKHPAQKVVLVKAK